MRTTTVITTSCITRGDGIMCIKKISSSEGPTWQYSLYSQRCAGGHFLCLSGPHSVSAPFLINQDMYPLMHRDEQSAWQAGSYSFLTPASTEWCNRTAGPYSFSSFSCCLPISPVFLFLSVLLCTIPPFIILTPLFIPLLSWLLFTRSLVHPDNLALSQRPVFPCLHYTQLLPSINYLPTPL